MLTPAKAIATIPEGYNRSRKHLGFKLLYSTKSKFKKIDGRIQEVT